VKWKL